WMCAREALMQTPLMPNLARAFPVITPGASDTASFDECLELLHLGGRPLYHAVLMMIPEAWENHATMSAEKRAFFRYHSSLMEPWDGPASISYSATMSPSEAPASHRASRERSRSRST